jgi:hypothetical protein
VEPVVSPRSGREPRQRAQQFARRQTSDHLPAARARPAHTDLFLEDSPGQMPSLQVHVFENMTTLSNQNKYPRTSEIEIKAKQSDQKYLKTVNEDFLVGHDFSLCG